MLDEAYRRAFRFHGMRMQQLTDSGADRLRGRDTHRTRRLVAAARNGHQIPHRDILNLMLLSKNEGQEPGKIGEREQNWDPLLDV